jgi:uncharacterized protein YndB with AHSA1/START domain
MWTRPEHLKAWYGPQGAAIPVADLDVRVGGTRFVCMEVSTPQGSMRIWFSGEYKEVLENQRLVYTESMADEHGVVAPASDAVGSRPATTEVRVEFQDIGGRTRMVLTHIWNRGRFTGRNRLADGAGQARGTRPSAPGYSGIGGRRSTVKLRS